MRTFLLLVCLTAVAATGCATNDLCEDQDKIRCCLLNLYTNQIMDNLVRASNGLPIIQLDYTNAQGQVTQQETAGLSDALATTRSTALTRAAASTLAVTRTTLNTLTGTATAQHTNQVSVSATPLTTANEVYDAYLEFLTLPGSLRVSACPPPSEEVHLCKRCGDRYYWVPVEYKKQFLALSLATTAQRGKALLPPDEFYTAKVVEVGKPESQVKDPTKPTQVAVTMKLDTQVPNDAGYMELTVNNKAVHFQVSAYDPPGAVARPAQTNVLRVLFDSTDLLPAIKLPSDLVLPLDVRLYLRHYRPTAPPTTAELLNRVNFQLQNIQFNQVRTSP
jgi:hypothetical protein